MLSNNILAFLPALPSCLIFMPHRAETLQNCVILLPTVTSIFHRAFLPCFINFPAFPDRAFRALFLHRPLYYRVTVISNNYAILLHLSFESLYLDVGRLLLFSNTLFNPFSNNRIPLILNFCKFLVLSLLLYTLFPWAFFPWLLSRLLRQPSVGTRLSIFTLSFR